MTRKAAFDAEEWSIVTGAPIAAATAVMIASPGGTVRETVSMARGYAEARQTRPIGLLLEVLQSAPPLQPNQLRAEPDAHASAMSALRRAIGILHRKAEPEEVEDYRGFVRWLAEAVAHAHKEGGILGIGGKPVSDAERRTLDEIDAALA